MNVRSEDYESITLVPSNITVEQKFTTLFSITDFKLTNATDQSKGIRMTITMKRKITSELVTTYFPSLLLMVISYATTFFKPFFFEAALSVNLTTMLVMTTIFISKMESLPPTSDIKMIDIWLILCQMVPFAEVILLTAMEYNREDKKKKGKKTKKKGEKKIKNLQTTTLAVAPANENMFFDEIKTKRLGFNCGVPSLKTLGEFFYFDAEQHGTFPFSILNKTRYFSLLQF